MIDPRKARQEGEREPEADGRSERGRKGRASHGSGRVYMGRQRVIVRKVKGRVAGAHRERRPRQYALIGRSRA